MSECWCGPQDNWVVSEEDAWKKRQEEAKEAGTSNAIGEWYVEEHEDGVHGVGRLHRAPVPTCV